MRKFKLTTLVGLVLSIVFVIGCTKKPEPAPENTKAEVVPVSITVTADAVGADGKTQRINVPEGTKFNIISENGEMATSTLPPMQVNKGEKVPYPGFEVSDSFPQGNPLKEFENKMYFVGYHKKIVSTKTDEAGVVYETIDFDEFDFDEIAKENTSIVALFVQPKDPNNVMFSFRTKHNKAPAYFEIPPSAKIKEPPVLYSDKTNPRLIFKGWKKSNCDVNSDDEKDKPLPCAWDFSKSINDNKINNKNTFPIHAVWEEVPEENIVVSFHTIDTPIGVKNPLPVTISKNTAVQKPTDFIMRENGTSANPATASEEGRVFVHWYLEDETNKDAASVPFDFSKNLKQDTKLYGHWEKQEISLKLTNPENLAESQTLPVAYGFSYENINQEIANHIFTNPKGSDLKIIGWKIKGANDILNLNETGKINFDTELEAVWQKNQYFIIFNSGETSVHYNHNGGSITAIDANNSKLEMPANVENINYGIKLEKIDAFVDAGGNKITPKFTAQPTNTTKYKSFEFSGWKTTENKMLNNYVLNIQDLPVSTSQNSSDGNFKQRTINLTATWRAVEQDKNKLKFVHPSTTGVANRVIQVSTNTILNKVDYASTDPTSHYYNFEGWYKNADFSEEFAWGYPITEDTIIYAKWSPKTFKINWTYEYKENILKTVNGKQVFDRADIRTKNLAGNLGFAETEDQALPESLVYGNTLKKPEIKNPLPNHKMYWKVTKKNSNETWHDFKFDSSYVGEEITITLIDDGFNNSSILDNMVKVELPNKTYVYKERKLINPQERPFNIDLQKEYYISKFEVTEELFSNQIDETKRYRPQADITVYKAKVFVKRLNKLLKAELTNWKGDGKNWEFAIPTEEQWRWASFGGIYNEFSGPINDKNFPGAKGDSLNDSNNSKSLIGNYAVVGQNVLQGTNKPVQKVGTRLPNELGLYDMAGNMSEIAFSINSDSYRRYGGDYKLVDQIGLFNRLKPWSYDEIFPDEAVSSVNTSTTGLRLVLIQSN